MVEELLVDVVLVALVEGDVFIVVRSSAALVLWVIYVDLQVGGIRVVYSNYNTFAFCNVLRDAWFPKQQSESL